MAQPLNRLKESPSQTAGPYVHIGTTPNFIGIGSVYPEDLGLAPCPPAAKGKRIIVTGQVFDGAGAVLRDALIEIWQADADGLYPGHGEHRGAADPNFPGWFRQPVDSVTGLYRFETIKPGQAPFPDGRRMAPHISFWIAARGINTGLHTRLYFGDEQAANAADPLLGRVEQTQRVATLIAPRGEADGVPCYRFDIHLQGDKETIFLDI
ncbi:MAG: protocatechuate 3,4-dioxygenase subunit alpha [Rhodospirillales bacterium 20-64-7]|nr:MAG: protocatechuate 3,4-dioxygenase subunit alpha [Rhodospirillales bacterium 20-64-7]